MTTTKKDYTKRSDEEATTHRLLDEYCDAHWRPEVAVVALVFKAMWTSSLTADQVSKIGSAMANYSSVVDHSYALDRMVRAKVLRRYTRSGNRLYEVNY